MIRFKFYETENRDFVKMFKEVHRLQNVKS